MIKAQKVPETSFYQAVWKNVEIPDLDHMHITQEIHGNRHRPKTGPLSMIKNRTCKSWIPPVENF
jgi:hypothetical protein